MIKLTLALFLLGIGMVSVASAVLTPEIDPASGGSAIALISGAILVFRSRHRQ